MTVPNALGIIGVGKLAAFLVEGLRRGGDGRPIVLSPRGAKRAADLAGRFGCSVAADNQAVIDSSALTIVATPPRDALSVISALNWPAGRVLVCVAIDVDRQALAAAAPGATVVRAMPTAASAMGLGSTPIFPAAPAAIELFKGVGEVYPVDDERAFAVASALSVYHLWLYGLMETMADAAIRAGVPRETAVGLIAGFTRSAGAFALAADPTKSMRLPLDENGTPGTMTAQGLAVLEAADALSPWREAFAAAVRRSGGF